jgi:alkanesulfonate monooxygenase SsuD/methylene tetrahydromethanopterin reductase-like flavin-dependent oxidoreductase (luciferase family)
MVVTNMICMENREEAFEKAVSIGMNYYTSLQMHWLDNIPKPPGFPEWPELIPEPSVEQLKKAVEIGMVVVGDPDDCAKAVRKWEDIGVDQLCFSPTTTNMDQAEIIASMELFGTEVLPQFDKDPVHRTTRYRQAAGVQAGV